MALEPASSKAEEAGWASAIAYNFFGICMATTLTIHSIKVYQDLYTKDRRSVAHRRNKPTLTKSYRLVNILTLVSMCCYSMSTFSGIPSPFATSDLDCDISMTMVIMFIQAGKTSMYILFLTRLYTIYEHSAYSYSKKCIGFFTVLNALYGLMMIALSIIIVNAITHVYGHHDYPNWCGSAGEEIYMILATCVVLQDMSGAIGFIIAFMIPLRKTLKAIENSGDGADPKVIRKILYAGTKTAVLTGAATCSTLILLTFTATLTGAFSIPDQLVNQICMMLMTAYYPDAVYYQNICCLCIRCCDKRARPESENEQRLREHQEVSSRADSSTAGTGTKSVDTMSQLRVAGAGINENKDKPELIDEEVP
eukprot:516896_1